MKTYLFSQLKVGDKFMNYAHENVKHTKISNTEYLCGHCFEKHFMYNRNVTKLHVDPFDNLNRTYTFLLGLIK